MFSSLCKIVLGAPPTHKFAICWYICHGVESVFRLSRTSQSILMLPALIQAFVRVTPYISSVFSSQDEALLLLDTKFILQMSLLHGDVKYFTTFIITVSKNYCKKTCHYIQPRNVNTRLCYYSSTCTSVLLKHYLKWSISKPYQGHGLLMVRKTKTLWWLLKPQLLQELKVGLIFFSDKKNKMV